MDISIFDLMTLVTYTIAIFELGYRFGKRNDRF